MGLYSKMKTSSRLENEGIWLQIDETRIKLGRAGGKNSKFAVASEKLSREHKRAINLMSESQARPLFAKLYAENVVLDWLTKRPDGDLDEQGEPQELTEETKDNRWSRCISSENEKGEEVFIEYNTQNVLRTFSDIPDLLNTVKETAEDPSLFRQSLLTSIQGN